MGFRMKFEELCRARTTASVIRENGIGVYALCSNHTGSWITIGFERPLEEGELTEQGLTRVTLEEVTADGTKRATALHLSTQSASDLRKVLGRAIRRARRRAFMYQITTTFIDIICRTKSKS